MTIAVAPSGTTTSIRTVTPGRVATVRLAACAATTDTSTKSITDMHRYRNMDYTQMTARIVTSRYYRPEISKRKMLFSLSKVLLPLHPAPVPSRVRLAHTGTAP
jgi:hypothetical protein